MDYSMVINERELLDVVYLLKIAKRTTLDNRQALENKSGYRHKAFTTERELKDRISHYNKWIDIADELINRFDNVRVFEDRRSQDRDSR